MNFKEFEQLINSGVEEIFLTENVLLEDCEEEDYISGIEINADNLIIEGNGHIIDGNKKTPLLKVNAFNVTLKNFRFKNGYSEYSGGAIINNGSLTVVGCIFLDNSSELWWCHLHQFQIAHNRFQFHQKQIRLWGSHLH